MADDLDLRMVGFGACVQVAIAVPAALLVTTLRQDDIGTESNLWLVAALVALVAAPAVAGVLVGRRCPESPVLHAALASATGWLLVAAARLIRAAVADHDMASLVGSLLTIAPIQIGVAVLGALFARPRARLEADGPGDPMTGTVMDRPNAAPDEERGSP